MNFEHFLIQTKISKKSLNNNKNMLKYILKSLNTFSLFQNKFLKRKED